MNITELTLTEWQLFSPRFDKDIFDAITVEACINARNVPGGTARERVWSEIVRCREGK